MKKNKHASASYKFRIGSNIRKWRNLKDIKQKELAVALELSEAAVSNIENDITNLTVGQLEDISIALNVSIEQLLSDPQDKYRSYMTYGQPMKEDEHRVVEKELINAVIQSLEKKDEQLQSMMQHFVHTMNELLHHEKSFFNSSKQVASRA
ncbi:MAG: helix-turn-helix transcriptional regulator [Ferruginibacter sp.]